LRQRQPGVAALGHALNAVPELSEARTGHGDAWALALASALTQRLPGLDPSRARTVALVMIETATSLLDLAGQRPEAASEILEELAVLLGGYFAVLGDKGSHGPGAPSL
jgi:hypothetical protein